MKAVSRKDASIYRTLELDAIALGEYIDYLTNDFPYVKIIEKVSCTAPRRVHLFF
jgi:hypothetical protein